MTQNLSPQFYTESGKFSIPGLTISYTACLLATLFFGFVYTMAICIIPIIYLNIIITCGFSVFLGIFMLLVTRLSHNRNRKSRLVLAIVLGIAANYFQWTAFVVYALRLEPPAFGDYLSALGWIFEPQGFLHAAGKIYHYGIWNVAGFTPRGGALAFVWLIEALIILAGPIAAVWKLKEYPYSESTSGWYPKFTLRQDFESMVSTPETLEALSKNPLETIKQLKKGDGLRHTKIQVFYSKEEENQYLTFERIYYEGQGKGTKHTDIVINNLQVSRMQAEQILSEFENHRERLNVF